MESDEPLIVTSVSSRVVDELTEAVERAVGGGVQIRTGIGSDAWAAARAGRALSSLLIRLRGYLFPLRIDLGPRRLERVIIATTNPFLLPAIVALRRPRARLVTLVYDLYPESLEVRFRLPRPVKALLSGVTGFGLRRSAAVVFLGERTRRYVVDRYSLTCPTPVIPPGCDAIPRPSVPPPSLVSLAGDLDGKVVISYIGNMGSMHDADTLAEALRFMLASSGGHCAVVISTRGDRASDLVGPLAEQPDVTVLEHLDDDEWAWLTHRTDIALASLDARAGLVSLPSKIFASLAGGAAILAIAPQDSDIADLVQTFAVGVVTPPGDAEAAAKALARLVNDRVERDRFAQAAVEVGERFTPRTLSNSWRELLGRIG